MQNDKVSTLLTIARSLAAANPDFHAVRGPGVGDRATLSFMRELRRRASDEFGTDYSEQMICGQTSFAVDFYFPEDGTVVEIALGLPNSASEFEKDVLKALMAQDFGYDVHRLVFISRPGGARRCSQPGRTAVIDWARSKHGLVVEVQELEGEPRVQRRARSSVVSWRRA